VSRIKIGMPKGMKRPKLKILTSLLAWAGIYLNLSKIPIIQAKGIRAKDTIAKSTKKTSMNTEYWIFITKLFRRIKRGSLYLKRKASGMNGI